MKKSFKMLAALILSSAAVFSAASLVSAAEAGTGTAIKRTVLLGEEAPDGCDINRDETINVLDLMRMKYWMLNPIAEPETASGKYAYNLYRKVLLTEPDVYEAEDYLEKLENKEITAADLMLTFTQRPEYTSRDVPDDEFIIMLYNTFLDREPDERGYGNWTEKINYFSRDYIMRGFVLSSEFKGICSEAGVDAGDITLTEPRDMNYEVTRSVGQMYKRMTGNNLSIDKLNSIVQRLLDSEMTMQQVAFDFAESEEFASVGLEGEEFVNTLFYSFTDREPSDEERVSYTEYLSNGGDRTDLLRRLAASEDFYGVYDSRGMGKQLKRIACNFRKNGVWTHLEPTGWIYTVENEKLLNLLDECEKVLNDNGTSIDQIYEYCIRTTAYKYIEATKSPETIEEYGWTYFADYSMHNYYGVCYYLAAKMDILLEQAGYRCRVVHSTRGNGQHYWNQIYIGCDTDEGWTNYDVTKYWKHYTLKQVASVGNYVIVNYVRPEYK